MQKSLTGKCVVASSAQIFSGVYLGWAVFEEQPSAACGMVMSYGFNPFFSNAEATVVSTKTNASSVRSVRFLFSTAFCELTRFAALQEPHLFLQSGDFRGRRLYLAVCGFLRPEAPFASFGKSPHRSAVQAPLGSAECLSASLFFGRLEHLVEGIQRDCDAALLLLSSEEGVPGRRELEVAVVTASASESREK